MALMPNSQLVTVQDKTSKGVLTPTELFNLAWALNYQALYHYGRSQWVTSGLAPAAHVALLPHGANPPAGAWNIELLDTSDVEGALGYHEDLHVSQAGAAGAHATRHAGETPLSKVFVKTSKADGVDPAEVASHELLEMLVDPYVVKESEVRKVLNTAKRLYYIVEVGDPVQGCGYDIGAPEKRKCGVTVADFALPAWFSLPQVDNPTQRSFRSSVRDAFELAPGGYMSVAPEANPSEWTQVYGSDRPAAQRASDAYERPGDIG